MVLMFRVLISVFIGGLILSCSVKENLLPLEKQMKDGIVFPLDSNVLDAEIYSLQIGTRKIGINNFEFIG